MRALHAVERVHFVRPALTMGGKQSRSPWQRHNGNGVCPIAQPRQRIQWKVIGTHRTKVVRACNMNWTLTFEWRFL